MIQMKKRSVIISLVVAILMICASALAMGSKQVEQTAVVSGTVSNTITAGTVVQSGDSLVEISTLTGTASAARATVDGTVKQVLVRQGDEIKTGQIVAYIEQSE